LLLKRQKKSSIFVYPIAENFYTLDITESNDKAKKNGKIAKKILRVLKFTTLSQLTEITKKRTIIFWGLKVKIELLLEANLCDYRGVILILEILMT